MKNQKKNYLFHPKVRKNDASNPDLLRIHLTTEYTKIDFGYIAKDIYSNGGWIRIDPATYIEIKGTRQRFTLTSAENIPLAPLHHYFETKKDWRFFSLYFPPLPQNDCIISIIEAENGTQNDFNYFDIVLHLADGIPIL